MEKKKIRQFRNTLRKFERLIDAQQKKCCKGMSLAQCHVLLEIEEQEEATTGQIADSLNLDKSTLSRTIDGLVNLGLLKRLSHPDDRRFIPIALTEQGKTICNAINTTSDDYYRHFLGLIPSNIQEQVIASFDILVQAFLEHERHIDSKSVCGNPVQNRKGRRIMDSKNYFDSVANDWDRMRQGFFRENLRKKALDAAHLHSGKLAADIGAGTGFITEGLLHRGLRVIAVDQTKAMLEVLKSKLPSSDQIDCRVGEAENLPIEDNHVDYVFANMYLHHVENPPKAIKEMTRILKPGGTLVISDLDEHDFGFLKTEHHDRWMGFRREDIESWCIEAGMIKVKVSCAEEQCCAESKCGSQNAQVSIFIASGKKSEAIGQSTIK